MKKCYLDSNVLVYLKDNNSPHQRAATKLLTLFTPFEYELYISSLTIDEFLHSSLFILRQHNIARDDQFQRLDTELKSIMQIPQLRIVNPPTNKEINRHVIELMRDFHLNPRDAYHLLTMQENNIEEFATFDTDFKRVFDQKILKHRR